MSKDAVSHCTWLLLVLLALPHPFSFQYPMRTCVLSLHHKLTLTALRCPPAAAV